MHRGSRDSRQQRGGLIGAGIRGISAGIGLASESIHARSASKKEVKQHQRLASQESSVTVDESGYDQNAFTGPPPPYSEEPDHKSGLNGVTDEKAGHGEGSTDDVGVEIEDDLEDEWTLDDAQDELPDANTQGQQDSNAIEPYEAFLRKHPPPQSVPIDRLPMPVVLPQRRPKERSRGFIRAYAPVLENCDVDQETWLEFLELFRTSGAANPWISAINLASFATLAIPSALSVLVSMAIRQATDVAIEMQSRERYEHGCAMQCEGIR